MKVMVSENNFYQIMDTEGNKTDENTAAIEIFGTDCKKEKVGAVHSKLHKKWIPLYTAIINSAMTTVTSYKIHLERRWAYKHI